MTAVPSAGLRNKLAHNGAVLLIARLVVGGLMVYVSIEKLQDPVAFLKVVRQYEIVPVAWHSLLNSSAVLVPWIELLGGAALIAGIGLRGIGAVMFLMLIAFTATVFWRAWEIMQTTGEPFMKISFDCGCGTGPQIIWRKLLENVGLILLSLAIVLSKSRMLCLSTLLARSAPGKAAPAPEIH